MLRIILLLTLLYISSHIEPQKTNQSNDDIIFKLEEENAHLKLALELCQKESDEMYKEIKNRSICNYKQL